MIPKFTERETWQYKEWAKEEFFRQYSTGRKEYIINGFWHPVVRIQFCHLIEGEAMEELP